MKTATHPSQLRLFRPGHPDDWVERYGGFVVALAGALAGFAILYTTTFEPITAPARQKALEIVLNRTPPPVVEEQEPRPPSFDVAATSVAPSTQELVREAVRGSEHAATESEVRADPQTIATWMPSSDSDRAQIAAIQSQITDYGDRLKRTTTDMRAELNRLRVESAGREFIINSDGGREGAIRLLDVEGFDMAHIMPLLERYGISVEYRHVRPGQAPMYLNAANMQGGTFTSVSREGFYEVFVLSAKSVSMLASKELTAIQNRGYDPARTRVLRITFGVVKNSSDQLDLDVTELDVEQFLY